MPQDERLQKAKILKNFQAKVGWRRSFKLDLAPAQYISISEKK